MTAEDIVLIIFTAINSARVVAYIPQILVVARDDRGAQGVSCATWAMFAVSHLSTVLYAIVCVGCLRMTLVFTANFVASLLILGLAAFKRSALQRCRAVPSLA
jgi:hypothetical protein